MLVGGEIMPAGGNERRGVQAMMTGACRRAVQRESGEKQREIDPWHEEREAPIH